MFGSPYPDTEAWIEFRLTEAKRSHEYRTGKVREWRDNLASTRAALDALLEKQSRGCFTGDVAAPALESVLTAIRARVTAYEHELDRAVAAEVRAYYVMRAWEIAKESCHES